MLEYFKVILQKVSFDKMLFEKELQKALKAINEEEVYQLYSWCYEEFNEKHSAILDKYFSMVQI